MAPIGAKASAILLCAALIASACGDDGGGGDSGPVPGEGSPIDDVLGTQAVQDFTLHFGLWTLDDEGLLDIFEPILDHVSGHAGSPVDLAGGFTFAAVDGLDARMVDADGKELPTMSVDFGLLAPTTAAVDETRAEFAALLGVDEDEELAEALAGEAVAEPSLVEIVSADFSARRTHVGFGDRSEIDLTFVDALRPGAEVAALTLFGQTIPGDPAAEEGLGPTELFAHRWNAGLIEVVGSGGPPAPLLDSAIDVIEGSTILSRESKRQLGLSVGFVVGQQEEDAIVEAVRAAERDAAEEFDATDSAGQGNATGSGFGVRVTRERNGSSLSRYTYAISGQGHSYVTDNQWKAWAYARSLLTLEVCARVASSLVARNEAGRSAGIRLDRFPTLRPLDGDPADSVGSTVPGQPDPDEPTDEDEPEPEGQPLLSCGDPPDPDARPPRGGTHGDVRFLTFDGVVYAQQAVGEFLVFENDSEVIQMRAEPAGNSQGASIATAFALSTGGQSIAMHRGGRTFVDGERRELERGERIRVGDAEVLWGQLDGWTIAWPDGQLVNVFDRGEVNGMTLTVQPAASAGEIVGQLGNGDGDPSNDFRTRNGEQLDPSIIDDLSIVSNRDEFYAIYVDSWRISQDESLLHYGPGETTESFLIDGFPSTTITLDDLDLDARTEAEEACRAASVVDDRFYEGCVIDVAITGDPGYAYDAFRVQIVAGPADPATDASPAQDDPVDVTAATPGDTVLTIGTDTLVFGDDPPNQRDGGVPSSWDCQVTDGNLFADGSIDLADGPRYSITVQYLAAEPRFALTVQRTADDQTTDHAWVLTNVAHFADAVDDMTLDGSRLSASGELYVNDPPEIGLAPFSQLPAGATLDPFTLEVDCVS
ncbi:MAG: VWD domain-containing protein [Acidimicrobiales bacterium]